MADAELRVAVLGCGRLARESHLPILAAIPRVRVVALADASSVALQAAKRRVPDATTFDRWQASLAEVECDAVVVALPTDLHVSAGRAVIESGRHLYLEKPPAADAAGVELLVDSLGERAQTVVVGFNYRYNRLFATARRWLAEGVAGPIWEIRGRFTVTSEWVTGWRRVRIRGGGALLDLASHHVDLGRWLLGREARRCRCTLDSRQSDDDGVDLEVDFGGDVFLRGHYGFEEVAETRFEIVGEKGAVLVDRIRHQDAVFSPNRGAAGRIVKGHGAISNLLYRWEKQRAPGHEPSHRTLMEGFVEDCLEGRPGSPGLTEGWRCMQVLDAARKSSAGGGRWELVDAEAKV